ncbi:MAG: hypothetical protein ACOYZ6_15370 [Chloroflexota bacterium]
MSMDDILKVLVESRKQGQSSQGADPMTELLGGLLGGSGTAGSGQTDAMAGMLGNLLGGGQSQPSGTNQQADALEGMLGDLLGGSGQSQTGRQQSSLGGMMSLLEMFTGAGGQSGLGQSSMMGGNPLMGLIQPLVEPLAKKLKISPELAMIVVSFVLQKLLAHHPTSGRDSTQFDLDDLFNQVGSTGKINPSMLQTSGMVEELSRVTGMDEATATKSLNTAFTMVSNRALQAAGQTTAKPAGRTLKSAASSGKRITR